MMPQSLDDLTAGLAGLIEDLAQARAANAEAIGSVVDRHRAGAVNMVDYTTLRRPDRRELQNDLLDIGVTSLATTEANVSAKVHAARNVLRALGGDRGPWQLETINDAIDGGDAILTNNANGLFGPSRAQRANRIMVTLPSEAADDDSLVMAMVVAGMDIARINCAHDTPASWARMATHVRAASAATGLPVLISMDLPGPKLRTGAITDGPAVGRARVARDSSGQVVAPARIWLCPLGSPAPPPPSTDPASRPALPVEVDPGWWAGRHLGDKVKVEDARGRRRTFRVTAVSPQGILLEGRKNTYLATGAQLDCQGEMTVASGIPPVPQRLSLRSGDAIILTGETTPVNPPEDGDVARIGCALPEAIPALRPGDPVLFDDGAVVAVVRSVAGEEATLQVTGTKPGGQRLGAAKGINLPDTELPVTALTPEDEEHLPFIAGHADLVAISFVRTSGDIDHALERLRAAGAGGLGLVLKIETRQGFENLPAILLTAMQHHRVGVMIARGDLAVEVGFERLAEIPTQILALCEAAHIPTILATEVLDTLARTGQPSRAEITDAAAAQRAECVMLNKGPHILEAIGTLDDILVRMSQVQVKSRSLMRHIHSWDQPVAEPITD